MSSFHSKNIWITGASSGIGEALVKAFSSAGANLIISARRVSELERVKREAQHSDRIEVLPLNLEENHLAESWVSEAWSKFGGIDILINNGGIGQYGSVTDTKPDVERKIFEINFFAAVALTKAIIPLMIDQKKGRIMAIGSIAGKFGQKNLAAYSASKAAILLYYESLKEELVNTPLQVQVVSPGFINTKVTLNSLNAEGHALNKNSPAQENGMLPSAFAKKISQSS